MECSRNRKAGKKRSGCVFDKNFWNNSCVSASMNGTLKPFVVGVKRIMGRIVKVKELHIFVLVQSLWLLDKGGMRMVSKISLMMDMAGTLRLVTRNGEVGTESRFRLDWSTLYSS